jgi:Protein of unknown function (DUF3293)
MVDPGLLAAFRNTRFIVSSGDKEIILRVGELNQELDDLLARFEAKRCAFITAWSPGAIRLSNPQNEARQAALVAEIERRGYPFLGGRGTAEDGTWPPEDSILIIGIDRPDAKAVGKLFGQIAVVFAGRGKPVELLLCDD